MLSILRQAPNDNVPHDFFSCNVPILKADTVYVRGFIDKMVFSASGTQYGLCTRTYSRQLTLR